MLNCHQKRKSPQDKVCTMTHLVSNMSPLHSLNTTTALRYLRMSQHCNNNIASQLQKRKSQQDRTRMQLQMAMTIVR